jgi:hypothetical protein
MHAALREKRGTQHNACNIAVAAMQHRMGLIYNVTVILMGQPAELPFAKSGPCVHDPPGKAENGQPVSCREERTGDASSLRT